MAIKVFTALVINPNGATDDSIVTPAGATTPAQIIAALRPSHGNDTIVVMNDGEFVVDYPQTTAPSDSLKQTIMAECKGWARITPGYGSRSGDGGYSAHRATVLLQKDHRANRQNKASAVAFLDGWLNHTAGVAGNGGNSGNGGNGGNGGNSGNGGNGGNSGNGGSGGNGGNSGNGGNGGNSGNSSNGGNSGNSGNGGNPFASQLEAAVKYGYDSYFTL